MRDVDKARLSDKVAYAVNSAAATVARAKRRSRESDNVEEGSMSTGFGPQPVEEAPAAGFGPRGPADEASTAEAPTAAEAPAAEEQSGGSDALAPAPAAVDSWL